MSSRPGTSRNTQGARAVVGASGGRRPRKPAAPSPDEIAALPVRQRRLYEDVVARSSDVREQLALLLQFASRHAASTADQQAVRERLVAAYERHCDG